MNKIKVSDKHLSLIDKSLEAFARGRAGQFGILFELLFPNLDYKQKSDLEELIKSKLSQFGFHDFNKSENDLDAWNIHKLFDEHLSVKRNGGWKMTVNFDGPIDRKGLPEIEGFSEWVEFIFPEKMQEKMKILYENREYDTVLRDSEELFNIKYHSEAIMFLKEKEENSLTDGTKEYVVAIKYRKPIFNK